MGLKLVIAATELVLTAKQLKDHSRIDIDDEDREIEAKIRGVADWLEEELDMTFLSSTWDLKVDKLEDEIEIPRPPLQSVTSLKYYDTAGVEQTLTVPDPTFDVVTDQEPGLVRLAYNQTWPAYQRRKDGITIRFVAGSQDPDSIPYRAIEAVKSLTAALLEHREAVTAENLRKLPFVDRILSTLYNPEIV